MGGIASEVKVAADLFRDALTSGRAEEISSNKWKKVISTTAFES
jgi:hypothetical protein